MDLACAALEDMILPRLEDAWDLSLHALASIEESTHSIDQVVKLFKLLHQLLLRQELDSFFDVALLGETLVILIFINLDDLDKGLEIEHAAHMAIHQTRDALDLVAQVGQDLAISNSTSG